MAESLGFMTELFVPAGPAAAPVFGSAGTYRASSTASPQFAVPSGVAADDIIIVIMYMDSNTATISGFPTDFSYHPNYPYAVTGSGNHRPLVAWKRATAGDTGTYNFTLSSNIYSEGAAFRWTGCKTSGSPFDTASGGDTPVAQRDTSGTSTPTVNVTSLGANRAFVHIGTCWAGGTWTAPSGFTKRGSGGGANLIYLSDKTQATAANSGSTIATCTGSDKMHAGILSLIGN